MPHHIELADHLWAVLKKMSRVMGVEPEALANQAVFNWARMNGFEVPGGPNRKDAAVARPFGTPAVDAAADSLDDSPSLDDDVPDAFPWAAHPELGDTGEAPSKRTDIVAAPLSVDTQPISHEASTDPEAEEPSGFGSRSSDTGPVPLPGEQTLPPLNDDDDERQIDEPVTETGTQPAGPLPSKGVLADARRDSDELGAFDGATAVDPRPVTPAPLVPGADSAVVSHLELQVQGGVPMPVDAFPFVIGRALECNLVIASAQASRAHAHIKREGDAFVVEDRASANGTWFEGKRIERRRLNDGDVIVIGNHEIKVRISDR